MNELSAAAMEPRDIPVLKQLWRDTFGDPDELIDSFFELLCGVGTGIVCRDGREPVAMAYLLDGMRAGMVKCSYIYAVATKSEYRGRGCGAALMRACRSASRQRGNDVLCTSPAEPSLYDWYEGLLDMQPVSFSSEYGIEPELSGALPAVRPADASEYNLAREQYLCGSPHVSFSDNYIALELAVCRACGGGLFAVGSGFAACYPEDGVLKIRELMCPEQSFHVSVAALAGKLGCRMASVQGRSFENPCIAAAPSELLPKGLWWGLALD